ncbi:uncharacterized protein [Amphiura filiformis]|uniref:uncharacterized protein n=1 Tax=Amphiura filiformis TaxID=82378 RepID=UPI003B2159E8
MGATFLKNRVPVDEGPIGMLDIDTLLVIFNFLSLYEKLIAMRVSKEWHLIIKNHAWTVIDFRDEGPNRKVEKSSRRFRRFVSQNGPSTFEYRQYANEWKFPMNEYDVLKFLPLYAGIGLQEIHLSVASDEIISYFRVNCPNIKTLGVRFELEFKKKDFSVSNENLSKLLYFLPKLQRLDLTWPAHFIWYSTDMNCYSEQIIQLLQNSNLRYISLPKVELSFLSMLKKMSPVTLTRLREMQFHVKLGEEDAADEILSSTVGCMTSLTCFKLTGEFQYPSRFSRYTETDGDKLLPSIAHWTHLKILTLLYVHYSTEAFEMMIQGLPNLETHVLEGESVTSSVVNLISIHLKKIKSLQLYPPFFSKYSSESLQSLSYHPTLENLAVQQAHDEKNQTNWVERIYDILVTLPKIKNVKLTGYNLVSCFSQASYPIIECAEIEVILCEKHYVSTIKEPHRVIVTSKIMKSEMRSNMHGYIGGNKRCDSLR